MSMSLSDVRKVLEDAIHGCCDDIKQSLVSYEESVYLRNEVFVSEHETKYIVEIISPKKKNVDDYGIAIDLTLQATAEKILCQVDVLKSDGPIYLESIYKIDTNENLCDSISLNPALEYIRSLPKKVVQIYMAEYA